jgi:hypothetical protein
LGLYPVGSVVMLNTEEIGIVYEPNPLNPKKPKVGIIRTRYGKPRHVPVIIDLDDPYAQDPREIVRVLDPVQYKIDVEAFLKRIAG